MRLDCGSAVVRPWQDGDRAPLVRHENNRKVWRNLKDRFPNPYTDEDARAWRAPARCVHIGYWLCEPFRGRGIMTASMRVLEKCGYVREGLLRKSVFKDGEIIDSVLYAKVAP